MNLLKTFFLNLLLFFLILPVYGETLTKIFRSNANGLELIEIDREEMEEYKFILYITETDGVTEEKVLFREDEEIKKWSYRYNEGRLYHEKYFEDRILKAEYRYDTEGHKIKQEEYKNNKKIKVTTYQYNEDGLVDNEEIFNLVNNSNIYVKYRYDRLFRIKQIEKRYPDGSTVFWEAFFTDKGIIQKEHYTLTDERYTFWYNRYGQETKGQIIAMEEMKEGDVKKEWESFYTKAGKKERKEENNYSLNQSTKTWYTSNFKEKRVELYKNNEIYSIDIYDYDDDSNMIFHEQIIDLNSEKNFYTYNEAGVVSRSKHYYNDKLKKVVMYNDDRSRTELYYGKNNKKVIVEFDSEGQVIPNG